MNAPVPPTAPSTSSENSCVRARAMSVVRIRSPAARGSFELPRRHENTKQHVHFSFIALAFESHREPNAARLGVVERAEGRRAGVVLHLVRQECRQDVSQANAHPRLKPQDLEPALQ